MSPEEQRCRFLASYYRQRAERHDADAAHCQNQVAIYERMAQRWAEKSKVITHLDTKP